MIKYLSAVPILFLSSACSESRGNINRKLVEAVKENNPEKVIKSLDEGASAGMH